MKLPDEGYLKFALIVYLTKNFEHAAVSQTIYNCFFHNLFTVQ